MTDDSPRQPPEPGHKPADTTAKAGPPDAPGTESLPILAQDFAAGSLYALRSAVAAHVTQAGMPELRARDVVLAVHELAANVIRHGAGSGRLLITTHGGALHCQVTDGGIPQAAAASPEPGPPAPFPDAAPWPSQHGHGLWVVRQVADHLSVQSGPDGTIATASFTLPPG